MSVGVGGATHKDTDGAPTHACRLRRALGRRNSSLRTSRPGASSIPLPSQLGGLSVTVQDSSNQTTSCSMVFVSTAQASCAIADDVAPGPAIRR